MINSADEDFDHIQDETSEFHQTEFHHFPLNYHFHLELSDDQIKLIREGVRFMPTKFCECMMGGMHGCECMEPQVEGNLTENKEGGRPQTSKLVHVSRGIEGVSGLHNRTTADFTKKIYDPFYATRDMGKKLLEIFAKGKNKILLPANHLLRRGRDEEYVADIAFTRSVNFKRGRLNCRIYKNPSTKPVCIIDISSTDPALKESQDDHML